MGAGRLVVVCPRAEVYTRSTDTVPPARRRRACVRRGVLSPELIAVSPAEAQRLAAHGEVFG
jgi:hypothetical protein